MERRDVAVVGAGLVGLATAYRLLLAEPHRTVVVLEKERAVALHQSGRNSGVIHAGLSYAPGSLKALTARAGRAALLAFAREREIPFALCGKLVAARDGAELVGLHALRERGERNGLAGLELLSPAQAREREPHLVCAGALWVPETGVIDFPAVARALAAEIERRGGTLLFDCRVLRGTRDAGETVLETTHGEVRARVAVACAGLRADAFAQLAGGTADDVRILPFRGDYLTLTGRSRALVKGLVYPVPDPRFPFLGVHLTRHVDGNVTAGPNAVLALAREGYTRRDVNFADLRELAAFRGSWRLIRRYWRRGLAEQLRDLSTRAFLRTLRDYVPEIDARDVTFGPSGVRAQAVARDGRLVDDFLIEEAPGAIVVRNAPSPAATAALAIGETLAARARAQLGDAAVTPRSG